MANLHVREMDEQVLFQLKMISKEQGMSLSALVRAVLEQYVADKVGAPYLDRFEEAIRKTQSSLDANTEAYNKSIEDNQKFRRFMTDLITEEDLETLLNETNYNVSE